MPVLFSRALVLVLLVALGVPAASTAASARVVDPTLPPGPATRSFTAAIEPYAEYNGQTLCDPTSKPGLLDLAALLKKTYGSYGAGIVRSCSDGGVSEHKEGRALDWMVSKRVPEQKKAAKAFLKWLLATDQFGNEDAMARRLGVMYIGWNNRMWRSYDPTRGKNGWDDLKTCTTNPAMKAKGYDTYCHRNHIHLSFSWDGADGATSFWTGKALTTPDCSPRSAPYAVASAGSPADPELLLDTSTGHGTSTGAPCRLAVPRWDGDDRSLAVRVPVPDDDGSYGLRVRVEKFDSNAPGALRLDTSATSPVNVTASKSLPYETILPIGANGVVTLATNAGEAFVRLVGLGVTRISDSPPGGAGGPTGSTGGKPRSSLHVPATVVTGTSIAFKGRVKDAPAGAKVQRYLKVGKGTWARRGGLVTPSGAAWTTSTAAPSPQKLRYKVAVVAGGKVVGWSKKKQVVVTAGKPRSSFHPPAGTVRPGASFLLKGRVKDAPGGVTVQRYLKVGSAYEPRGSAVAPSGRRNRWKLTVSAPSTAGPLTYRIAVLLGGSPIGWSKVKTIKVG
jgi:hypothetical protein